MFFNLKMAVAKYLESSAAGSPVIGLGPGEERP
jgi:hypothetical protein